MRRSTLFWIIGYLICMAIVVMSMLRARERVIGTYGTGEAQQQWDTWRDEAARNSGETEPLTGPVQRRKPKSSAPPAMVLMQDYFAICLVFSLVMTSALFATTMIALRGVFGRSSGTAGDR